MSPPIPHPNQSHPDPSDLAARLERELLPLVEHGPTAGLVRQAITALQASPAPSHGSHVPLPITDHLVAQLQERAQRGLSKYGTTLDRDDLTTADWLLHAIEERLDDVGYMEAARRRALKDQARIAELEAMLASYQAGGPSR